MTRLAAALAVLALLLAATNQWTGWDEGVRLVEASDVRSYDAIAAAAPGLPDADLPAQHARRFVPHWVLGSISEATGIGVHSLYRVAWGALVILIVGALHFTLVRLRPPPAGYWLAMGLLVANAYAFRYYAIVPGVLADLVLVAGLSWALYGLVAGRFWIVAAGLAAGAIGRETLIPLLPLIVAWLALGPPWRALAAGRRALLGAAAAACVVVPYVLLRLVSDPFSLPATLGLSDFGSTPQTPPAVSDLTLLGPLGELPGSASEIGEHVLRVLAPHIPALALLAAALWVARVPLRRLGPVFWLGIATWALVVAQPLGLSPEYAADNETRLSAIGLVPLLVAVAALPAPVAMRPWRVVLAALLLGAASMHHLYTTLGPSSAAQFVALEAVAAVALALLWAAWGRGGRAEAESARAPSAAAG